MKTRKLSVSSALCALSPGLFISSLGQLRPSLRMMKKAFSGATLLALFFGTSSIANAQNYFVSVFNQNKILKVTPQGAWCEFASSGSNPLGLAFGPDGYLYVPNYSSGTISRITTNGEVSQYASGLGFSVGLAFKPPINGTNGGLFITTQSPIGSIKRVADGGGSTGHTLFASGLGDTQFPIFDAAGNLFVASRHGQIYRITPLGVVSQVVSSGLTGPTGLAFKDDGHLLVSELDGHRISHVNPDNGDVEVLASNDEHPNLFHPHANAIDANGNLIVVSSSQGTVMRVEPDEETPGKWNVTTVLSTGGALYGIAIGPEGFGDSVLCPGEEPPVTDTDGDGVPDDQDICEGFDDNSDTDVDGVPDGCDSCPFDAQNDADGDGVCGDIDVCLGGDDNADSDLDGSPDACDICPIDFFNDADDDGFCANADNCPAVFNSSQSDKDLDGVGDECDSDDDNDGHNDDQDNCPLVANDQADFDGDGAGDVCDADVDGDGVADDEDQCLLTPIGDSVNGDGCGISQLCPCDNNWKNHGAYVRCVAHTANDFVELGLISDTEHDDIVSAAGQSSCGAKQ